MILLNISNWNVEIQKDGITICEIMSASNYIFVDGDLLTNVNDGDVLTIITTATTGISSKSKSYSHTFHETNNNIIDRLNLIETQLLSEYYRFFCAGCRCFAGFG